MRVAEVCSLTLADVAQLPRITWIGKGRKPRKVTASPALADAISRLTEALPATGPSTFLIQPMARNGDTWRTGHNGINPLAIRRLLNRRTDLAATGHVAPHDLRRSAAGMLHDARSADGGHIFDLLDIQQVLGHADPATTMKCYLQPMNTDTLDKAAAYIG